MMGVTREEGSFSLLDQDVYSQNSTSCDRRLSRAARTLIQRHVLRALSSSPQEQEESSDDVWTLLDQWLGKAPPTCPLLPNLDVLRQDEEQFSRIRFPSKNLNWAYPTHILQHRRHSSSLRPTEWCQCGYCGKTFATRFYLDLHVMHQHHDHHTSSSSEEASMICPATEWCRVVGLANCHQQALEDEPYYDRGSGGWGDDRTYVKHKWTKVTHSISCDLEAMEADCRSVLQACGVVSGDLHFCDSMTCPTHHFLWHLPDDWQDTWLQEAQHHPGLLGILLVIAIILWVYAMTPSCFVNNSKPHPPGKRLLQKSARPRASSRPLFQRSKRD